MTLDELIGTVSNMLGRTPSRSVVEIERMTLAGRERVKFTRKLREHTRYMRITPLDGDEVPFWEFEVLGGMYGHKKTSDDFDGRVGGDGPYVLGLIKLWLVDEVAWEEFPAFVAR